MVPQSMGRRVPGSSERKFKGEYTCAWVQKQHEKDKARRAEEERRFGPCYHEGRVDTTERSGSCLASW